MLRRARLIEQCSSDNGRAADKIYRLLEYVRMSHYGG